MKKPVPVSSANRLINHGPVILVTSQYKDAGNIVTLAWNTPVSHSPMLVAIAIAKNHYSNGLVTKSGEFVINVPNVDLLKQVQYCGSVSGREEDKWKKSGLTAEPAQKVKPPLIRECIAHLECKVVKTISSGDHSLFIGQVLAASAEDGLFDEILNTDNPRAKTLHHLGGDFYTVPGKKIQP